MTKKPPVSLRIPEETRVAVEQWATEQGVPRNAAYVQLIQRGLKLTAGSAAPQSALKQKRSAGSVSDAATKAVPEKSPATGLSVPFGGDLVRKPYQKGTKK